MFYICVKYKKNVMKKKEDYLTKKIVKEVTTTSVDMETGEVKISSNEREQVVAREPDYIKLYIEDLVKLKDLPKATNDILYNVLKRMNYQNEIILVSHNKKKIASDLGIKPNTIDQNLMKLTKKGILTRVARGVYIANPYLFGRGKWQDIKSLRMKVVYNKNGKFITTEVDKQQEFDFD